MSFFKSNPLVKTGRKLAYQQISISIIIVLIFTLVTYFFWGLAHSVSVLTGGVIGIIPNVIFAYKAFKHAGARSSKLVVESFFSGVKIKMIVTAVLFSVAFKVLTSLELFVPLPFFGIFCLIMAMPLFAPILFKL
mgnify:FL=1